MRRMAWCNEGILYTDTCALCKKPVVSQYAPKGPRPVYCVPCWWGGKWNPMDYGREIDWSRSILEQIHELELSVPHTCTTTDTSNENSEYTHHAGHQKNCYMTFHTSLSEDCYYGYGIKKARSCVDCHYCHESELCYESVDVQNCYNLAWSQDCKNCRDSRFIRDCIGCSNCVLCVGLRNKQYCIFNEQLTPAEYEKRISELQFGSHSIFQELLKHFLALQRKHTWKCLQTEMVEDSVGDHLYRARDAYMCFDCSDIEHAAYCSQLQLVSKYCADIYQFGIQSELCYESAMVGYNIYNCQFCFDLVEQCFDLLYCISCAASKNCFGCVGLTHGKNCILNKQYTEREYTELLRTIVEKMRADGEFGEYFPMQFSPFGYNESIAQLWYPMTRDKALKKGWKWQDALPFTKSLETLKTLPDTIQQVLDSLTEEVLACESCHRNYKIIPQELKFYRSQDLPLPRECFPCRRLQRMKLRNPRKLWTRPCMKCGKEMETTYSPERPETVYCEECYLKKVY
ncbi:MAG TPA: hypothetical protein VJB10_00980 [Candidatus Peribacteraceae bacterium]|nr:hypothetical protein [Candidatus Peribacteraceae bacterium]